MDNRDRTIQNARLLVSRLERLSADSYWAHRASGLRGSLFRCLEKVETGENEGGLSYLEGLNEQGFEILNAAAGEIAAPENDPLS